MTDLWIAATMCIYTKNKVLHGITDDSLFEPVYTCLMAIGFYRICVLGIELKQAWLRIIDLDCDEYNTKYNLKSV